MPVNSRYGPMSFQGTRLRATQGTYSARAAQGRRVTSVKTPKIASIPTVESTHMAIE